MSDDVVGYARPPKRFQFQKGQSGNPKGRPRRKESDISDVIANVVNGEASYSEGGQRKLATRTEVSLRALLKHALMGDLGAAEEIIRVLRESGGSSDRGLMRVSVTGWLPEYPRQTAEERNSQAAKSLISQYQTEDSKIERQT